MIRGNCYVAAEALWHILGARNSSWEVWMINRATMKAHGFAEDTHWFLVNKRHDEVLDPSRRQFNKYAPPYHLAKRAAFLTKQPSKRAVEMMEILTWQ